MPSAISKFASLCVFTLLFLLRCSVPAEAAPVKAKSISRFAMGADFSLLQSLQDQGVCYREAGQVKDPLAIFKAHGGNWVRLRLFVHPDGTAGQVNTLPYTLALAKRVKSLGMSLLLDLHYSDGWADPKQQTIPAAWQGLSQAHLAARVFTYTRDTLASFARAGCLPEMVQVGNEITNGMLWPNGGPPLAEAKWDALADLLNAGIRGVHASDPKGRVKIMLHIDRGGDKSVSRWFFDHCRQHGVPFDVIGLSYYPFWNGTLVGLHANLDFLASAYQKEIVVVETSGDADQGSQKAFLEALIQTVAATKGGLGKGVFYWAPEWIEGQKWNAPHGSRRWENRALFDETGNMRPAMTAFEKQPHGTGE